MNDIHGLLSVIIMSGVTILLRFIPFWVFGEKRSTPAIILYLGKVLPYAVMAMLVVYCLKDVNFAAPSGWIPALLAAVVTSASYVWKRSTLLSIGIGTVLYMILIQFVFI